MSLSFTHIVIGKRLVSDLPLVMFFFRNFSNFQLKSDYGVKRMVVLVLELVPSSPWGLTLHLLCLTFHKPCLSVVSFVW